MRNFCALLLSSVLCSALCAKDGLLIAHVTDGYDEIIHGEIKETKRIDEIVNPALMPLKNREVHSTLSHDEGLRDSGVGITSTKIVTPKDENVVVSVKEDEKALIKEMGACEVKKDCKEVRVGQKNIPYAEAKKEYARIMQRNTCITKKCIIGTSVSDMEAWFHIAVKTALDRNSYFYGISLDYAGENAFKRLMLAQKDLTAKYGSYKIVKSSVSSHMTSKNERAFQTSTLIEKEDGERVKVSVLGTMVKKSAPKKGVVDLKIKEIYSIKDRIN